MFGVRFNGAFTTEYAGIDNITGKIKDVVGTTGDGVAGIGTNPELRANTVYAQWDFVLSWDVELNNPATLAFSVLNVTDEEPPLDPNGLLTYNSGLYDGRGRMFRIQWMQGF